ncbi:CPBP family intramembrane metalloprotease [Ligilactobacillus sp. WILCCON 0076]|uniref:CPBP family intramembrane metalloprotease n=1 Tax=Ligilactobacillus ubinensis TaxID=2876789 RepID=A0A9X2FKU1_9LACO|nr:type II CAAX endopeptidase family protein [Ligilactobacillus ubinensis]MCP0886373.1 CPBP family intramembrane metalloprotease [Ligilactobacillus ubinensis]
MALKRNSLFILIGYFFVMNISSLVSFYFAHSNFLYPSITIFNLIGCSIVVYLNIHFPYQNKLEEKPYSLNKSIMAIILGIIGVFLVQKGCLFIEVTFLNQTLTSNNTNILIETFKQYPYYALVITLTAPIMEELVFRKVLFGNLTVILPPIGAAILSSILFSLVHNDGHYLTYACMGLVFCYVYAKTKRISASMAVHIGMNILILLL